MYAKVIHINIKDNDIDKYIPYYTITDTFSSLINKVLSEYKMNSLKYTIKHLLYKCGHVDKSTFETFAFYDKEKFTFQTEQEINKSITNDEPYEHKFVDLKCMIDEKGDQKKINLPSKNADKNLQSVLAGIPKKFPIVSVVDWSLETNGHIINKTDSQQFAKILSKTAPPVIIKIIEKKKKREK
eukprot:545547_1